ncbi:MAG: hypothetical protein IKN64_02865 [Desulfovibrio sp.]|nr:hypothetical protein [Desulfovibrio sp.]
MTKKFSVGISDSLAARLEPFKDKISPTAVFQNAMEKQIETLEQQKKRLEGEDMEAIIERLRKEKAEYEDTKFDEGEEEGYEFAKSASYEELLYAATTLAETCDLAERDLFKDALLGGYFASLEDENGDNLLKVLDEEAYGKWLAGWAYGVSAFWREVGSKI